MREKAPWRASVDFCFYGTIEDAAHIDAALDNAILKLTGIPSEGGYVGRMDPRDVVEGSPLDQRIRAERGES